MAGKIRKDPVQVNRWSGFGRLMEFQLQRDAPDGADVVGHVVAGLAVAAGGGVGEFSVPIEQGNGDAVDLGLDGDGDVLALEVFLEALIEIDEFLLGTGGSGFFHGLGAELEDVVDAEHGDGVLDLLEALDGRAADALGDGVRVAELGVLGFEGFELAVEAVELGVGDFGISLVVELVVALAARPGARASGPAGWGRGRRRKDRARPWAECRAPGGVFKQQRRYGISTTPTFFSVKRTTSWYLLPSRAVPSRAEPPPSSSQRWEGAKEPSARVCGGGQRAFLHGLAVEGAEEFDQFLPTRFQFGFVGGVRDGFRFAG